MKQKIKNIFSRKFILSACLVAGGVGTALKAASNPNVQIAGIVAACVAAVVYAWVEGKIDQVAVEGQVFEAIKEIEAIQTMNDDEEV